MPRYTYRNTYGFGPCKGTITVDATRNADDDCPYCGKTIDRTAHRWNARTCGSETCKKTHFRKQRAKYARQWKARQRTKREGEK